MFDVHIELKMYRFTIALLWTSVFVNGYGNESGPSTPMFPLHYISKATLYIPYSEIIEPLYAWYDADAKSSRIDYYGGMVKTYQLENVGKLGEVLKVAPVTTEESLNVETCLQINGSEAIGQIKIQSVLPDLTGYKFIGQEMTRGVLADKWEYIETVGDRRSKYTMYIQNKNLNKNADVSTPVKFVMKGMNTIFGSHYDHYWIDYSGFSAEKPDPSVFEVSNLRCVPFPGPGVDHVYTFNPMREFINGFVGHVDYAFNKFIDSHNKNYSIDEMAYRKIVFQHNMRFIHSKNRARKGYNLAPNHFVDKTPMEIKVMRGRKYSAGYNGGKPFPYNTKVERKGIPESFDWRLFGAVTPVKDQSVCGSCWSFGTTGTLEGAYFIHTGHLVSFSEQALIDCSWGFGNNGCDGGEDFRSYEWIMKHGGIPSEEEYGPYFGQDGYCHYQNETMYARITNYFNVTANDEDALKIALLKHGPISIAIDASHRSFSFYSNGIYYEPNCGNTPEDLDHAVLLVGYGKIGKNEYWLVKNSWSNYWGNDGYVLMSPQNNNCGVMTAPTYVVFN